jgi:hypothetical protein
MSAFLIVLVYLNLPILKTHLDSIYGSQWLKDTFGNPGFKLLLRGAVAATGAISVKAGFSAIDLYEHKAILNSTLDAYITTCKQNGITPSEQTIREITLSNSNTSNSLLAKTIGWLSSK